MRSNKLRGEIDSYLTSNVGSSRGSKFYAFRANANVKQERTVMRKKIFGEHYNFSKVGLNKEKKYMIEEQKNTEIERSNRILLEKIQRISKRSGSKDHRKRTMTEHGEVTLHFEELHEMKSRHLGLAHRSVHHLQKIDKLQNSGSARTPSKILFQGSISYQGRLILVKTYIEKSKVIIAADISKLKHKLTMDIEAYRTFLVEFLEEDHSKIVEHLTFNGKLLELTGLNEKGSNEKEEVSLPPISLKPGTKDSTTNVEAEVDYGGDGHEGESDF